MSISLQVAETGTPYLFKSQRALYNSEREYLPPGRRPHNRVGLGAGPAPLLLFPVPTFWVIPHHNLPDAYHIDLFFLCILFVVSMMDVSQNPTPWKTPARLLACLNPDCTREGFTEESDVSFRTNSGMPFMVDGTCNFCKVSFTVCTKCERARTQHSDSTSVQKHCTNMHNEWHRSNMGQRSAYRSNMAQRAGRKRGAPPATQGPEYASATRQRLTETDTASPESDDAVVEDNDPGVVGGNERPYLLRPVYRQEDIGTGQGTNSAAYFFNEGKKEGAGLDYLVGRAHFKTL